MNPEILKNIELMKKKNPHAGQNIYKKTTKREVVDPVKVLTEKFLLVPFSEITGMTFYFKDKCWRFANRGLEVIGNMQYRVFIITATGHTEKIKEATDKMLIEDSTKKDDTTSDKKKDDINKPMTNKFVKMVKKVVQKLNLKTDKLDVRCDFYKGSTEIDFGNIEAYQMAENKYLIFADMELKKVRPENVDYSDVLERLKKGQLETVYSDGTRDTIREEILSMDDIDKLIDEDIEQIMNVKGIDKMTPEELDELERSLLTGGLINVDLTAKNGKHE